MSTIGELKSPYATMSLAGLDDMELNWEGGTLDLSGLAVWWNESATSDSKTVDGNDSLVLDDRPIPVEPDGGIGDGAGPILVGGDSDYPILIDADRPIPVEPDGGIGDGAGPIPVDEADGEVTILPYPYPIDPDDVIVGPIPVEPDGGIGDGAGPIPVDEDEGEVTILPYPYPIDPDEVVPIEGPGGIGDGAVGIPENNIFGGGEGTEGNDFFYGTDESETFIFKANHGYDMITDFDVEADRLDLSGTEYDFTDLQSLLDYTKEDATPDGTVYGVMIETGDGSAIYIADISIDDLAFAQIDY